MRSDQATIVAMTAGRLSDDRVRALRMRAQGLSGRRATDVEGVLERVFALQAQDAGAARLAVRARSARLDVAAVARAVEGQRSVVRTWAMRGTLHMLPAEDVRWVVALLGPNNAAAGAPRRRRLGLTDDLCERAVRAMRSILSDGPLTRAELVRRLARRRVRLDPKTNAAAHLCAYGAAHGVICRGPDLEGDEPTYVLLDDWVRRAGSLDRDAALTELARRYVRGHGPAGVADLAAWSGLPRSDARRAFEFAAPGLREVATAGGGAFVLAGTRITPPSGSGPAVRLLGAFDAYLVGYAGRALALPPRHARRIQAGGGWIHPAVVVDGRVVGTWRLARGREELTVTVSPFGRIGGALVPAIAAETSDVGRFLGRRATPTIALTGA